MLQLLHLVGMNQKCCPRALKGSGDWDRVITKMKLAYLAPQAPISRYIDGFMFCVDFSIV